MPHLGSILHVPRLKVPGPPSQGHAVASGPSALNEAFRALSSTIQLSREEHHFPHVLVVTSPCSGEGRTTIATRLGMTLAASGCHVLLIDGDLRKPSLNRQFGMIEEPGVSDVLQDRDGVVVPTGYPRLDLLGAGTPVEKAMELPSIATFRELLKTFAGNSDYVIIDAPPLEFSEALVMCAVATDVLLVVRAGLTTKESFSLAQERLNPLRSKVLGLIINDDSSSPLARRGSDFRSSQAGAFARRRTSEIARRPQLPHLLPDPATGHVREWEGAAVKRIPLHHRSLL